MLLKRSPRFAVVIPVYNHGRALGPVVNKALLLGWPIFVVDDGSGEDIDDALKCFSGVRVLRHPVNQGKGAALLTGFRAAAEIADFAVAFDADGQHDPEDARALVAAIVPGRRPIVVGERMRMDQPHTPWTSRFGRVFSNFWVRMAGGPAVRDTQSGFRIYPLPEVLNLEVAARRYQFELEVLIRAAWRNIPVIEAPVGVIYPPKKERISHFHPFKDFLRNTGMFARLIFRRVTRGIANCR